MSAQAMKIKATNICILLNERLQSAEVTYYMFFWIENDCGNCEDNQENGRCGKRWDKKVDLKGL